MYNAPFEMGPIRPVDEADSLLIRTSRGCPWNRCSFCSLYKDYPFSLRSVSEVKADIVAARDYYNGHPFKTCFLQDGDSFIMPTGDLVEILSCLKENFPHLTQISSYGRAQTMAKKSVSEIKEIHDAGLNKLYCGMESGSKKVLERVRKGISPESIIHSATMGREAGMEMTQFIILGLGGRELLEEHALETARVLSQINPDQIRLLTVAVKDNSDLGSQLQAGQFTLPSEAEIIAEQRLLLENLEGITSDYANHHSVDLLLEVRGHLPDDKGKMLDILHQFLEMDKPLQNNFILGRRLGYYRRLSDQGDIRTYKVVEEQLNKVIASGQNLEHYFHHLRNGVI